MERPDVFAEAVPDWMRSYKRVVSVGGSDGLVVAHYPVEADASIEMEDGTNLLRMLAEPDANEDRYKFFRFAGLPVSDLVNYVGGGEDIEIEIEPDAARRVRGFSRPQQKVDTSAKLAELTWQAPWTRIVAVEFYRLHYFEDLDRARAEAREHIEPYIRQEEST